MSHSKPSKRGSSLYIEKWNPAAKKHVNTCGICGKQGFNPSILEEGFVHPSVNQTDYVHSAMQAELTRAMEPLALDELGRCEVCARIMEGRQ